MKKARTLILLTCITYTGCAGQRGATNLSFCPSVHIPPKPILLSAGLTNESSPDEVEKAHVVDILALKNYSNQLVELLKNYQL